MFELSLEDWLRSNLGSFDVGVDVMFLLLLYTTEVEVGIGVGVDFVGSVAVYCSESSKSKNFTTKSSCAANNKKYNQTMLQRGLYIHL